MCPPMRAHCRHLANTIELMRPSARSSPQHKRQIYRFSRFCTTHGRKSHTLQWAPLSPNIAPLHGDLGPHLTHDFLDPSEPTIQTHLDRFIRFFAQMTAGVPILNNGSPLSPSKLPLPMGISTSGKCHSNQREVYNHNWVPHSPCLVGLY